MTLRELAAKPTRGPWVASRFNDKPQYDHMGPTWKRERIAEESRLVRSRSTEGLHVAIVAANTDAEAHRLLIVAAVNVLPALLDVVDRAEDVFGYTWDTDNMDAAVALSALRAALDKVGETE